MDGRRKDARAASPADESGKVGGFRSAEGQRQFLELLDAALEAWPERTDSSVETSFGTTAYSTVSATETNTTPVVLLQGGNSTVAAWTHLVDPWSKKHPVIAIDTVWEAGRSTQLAPVVNGNQASQWLAEVLDRLGLGRVHLVGYSYGAWTALNQAVRRPEQLASVTAIDPPGAITGIPLRAWARMIRLIRGDGDEALDFLAWVRNGRLPGPPMRDLLLSAQTQFVKRGSPLPRKLRAEDWENIAVSLQVIIAGSCQFVPRRAARTVRRRAPHASVHVLDGVGHAVLSDAPEDTASLVAEFISRIDVQ